MRICDDYRLAWGMTPVFQAGIIPLMARAPLIVQPEAVVLEDDGSIPNSRLPLLVYRQAFAPDTPELDLVIEQRFASNNWTGSWRAGRPDIPVDVDVVVPAGLLLDLPQDILAHDFLHQPGQAILDVLNR